MRVDLKVLWGNYGRVYRVWDLGAAVDLYPRDTGNNSVLAILGEEMLINYHVKLPKQWVLTGNPKP